jgi:hypothetical protein
MAKLIDYIALRLVAFIALSLLLYSFFEKFFLSAVVAALIVGAGSVVYGKFFAAKFKRERTNSENLFKFFLTRGNAYAAEYICGHIKSEFAPVLDGEFISFKNGETSGLIFPIFKYSKISKDEIVKIYRISRERAAQKVYIIAKNFDRDVFLAAADLGLSLSMLKIPVLCRYLKSVRALPPPPEKKQKPKTDSARLKAIAESVFSAKNGRRFLFAAVMTLLMSVLTPLKTYYHILSAISFSLSVLCLLIPSKSIGQSEIFAIKKDKKTK